MPDGYPAKWFYITDDADWRLFSHPGYGPMGEELEEMTPKAARRYAAWKSQKEAESEKQTTAEAEHRFRETYLNSNVASSSAGSRAMVMLAFRTEPSNFQADTLQVHIAKLLAKKNRHPVSGLFKPAFYTGGSFDDLWNADQSLIERLQLIERPSSSLLLGNVNFSTPAKTDFDGLVFVQGTLSIVVINKQGRNGPWVFTASGAGGDLPTANANCAKRLVEAIDLDVVFP